VLSARIAGPLYAFERFLDDLAIGKSRKLKLRAGDEFKHLEQLADRLNQMLATTPIAQDSNSNEQQTKPTGTL
jgi:hypothetical protein